jgi:hypothetical protein
LGVAVAKDVAIATLNTDAEIGFAGRIPAIFDLEDFQSLGAEFQAQGALVCFISGVGFDLDSSHRRTSTRERA